MAVDEKTLKRWLDGTCFDYNMHFDKRPPTEDDLFMPLFEGEEKPRGFRLGDYWVDRETNDLYIITDKRCGKATWVSWKEI